MARDRAMLLLGFGAALRRSELVGLALGDVVVVPGRGVTVRVRRSKTDPHGKGQDVAVCLRTGEHPGGDVVAPQIGRPQIAERHVYSGVRAARQVKKSLGAEVNTKAGSATEPPMPAGGQN